MKIISASRREDMPAFRMPYLLQKYNEVGEDTFWVLWTKNPENISGMDFNRVALQLTVTGLGGTELEPGVPTPQTVWDSTEELVSKGFNPDLINWRFDPVIPYFSNMKMLRYSAERAHALGISRCVISFVSWYGHLKKRWPEGQKTIVTPEVERGIAQKIKDVLDNYNITLYGCVQPHLQGVVLPSRCIDGEYYHEITGFDFNTDKDLTQRKLCGCTVSTDIGDYRACPHGCKYCYSRER